MASTAMTYLDLFVKILMKALRLPKRTGSFELRCAVEEVVTVKCEYFPGANNAAGFDTRPLLAEYRGPCIEAISESTRGTLLAGEIVFAMPALVLLCTWLGWQ